MYAIGVIRYRRPIEEIEAVTEEHRAYQRELKARGLIIAAGPLVPRLSGMALFRVPDENYIKELDKIRDGDPFVKHGVAQYEWLAWAPVMGVDGLNKL
jgi:uncharacterized protein YciI